MNDDSLKSGYSWLSGDGIDVLNSINATFLPSFPRDKISKSNINLLTSELVENFPHDRSLIDYSEISESKSINSDELKKISERNEHITQYLTRSVDDVQLTHNLCKKIDKFVTNADKKVLAVLLTILSWSLGNFLLTGYFKPFQRLYHDQRSKALISWKNSRFVIFRALFQNLKRMSCVIFFSYSTLQANNPNWKALRYDPKEITTNPSKNPSLPEALKSKFGLDALLSKLPKETLIYHSKTDLEITVDAVIIGSGCGGGKIADELSRAGLKVLVLEKGGYYDSRDFREWNEAEGFDKLYERGGLLATSDGTIPILAGSCVGGGSTVNWSASFRTPRNVLDDWEAMGLSLFKPGGEFEEHLNIALKELNVNSDNSFRPRNATESASNESFRVNLNNQLLFESAEKLGYRPEIIARNVKNCVDCGHCGYGCAYDAKQSTVATYFQSLLLQDRVSVLERCFVERILTTIDTNGKKKAMGVVCKVDEENSITSKKLIVNSKIVVCSAGSIHSPAVLLRSKLRNPNIGRHLCLHPVIGSVGLFPNQSTELHRGVSMGIVVRDASNRSNYKTEQKIAVETPPLHPGTLGMVMPWFSGWTYKMSALSYPNLAAFINIHRDLSLYNNRVEIDGDGNPVVHYQVSRQDKEALLRVMPLMNGLMYTARPAVMMVSSERIRPLYLSFENNIDYDKLTTHEWEELMAKDTNYQLLMQRSIDEGIVEGSTGLFSAHQMGSCRMSVTPSKGVVDPSGETWECSGLYIADASIFPTSLGINPMITVIALARHVGQSILKALDKKPAESSLTF